jgi:hypothetical protein
MMCWKCGGFGDCCTCEETEAKVLILENAFWSFVLFLVLGLWFWS